MSKTVSSAAVSSTVVENNLVPFGSALHGRDGGTITELGIFLVKAIGNAGNVARAGRTMDGRNQR